MSKTVFRSVWGSLYHNNYTKNLGPRSWYLFRSLTVPRAQGVPCMVWGPRYDGHFGVIYLELGRVVLDSVLNGGLA